MTRHQVITEAAEKCMKELYSFSQPHIEWDDFIQQNKEYRKKEEEYESLPDKPSYKEYVGPKPYEFYYLPKDILKNICNSYVYAYKMDNQQELLDTIETLKNYCKEPIVDKYIEDWTDETGFHHPGYRSYDHPDNLEKEIDKIITNYKGGKMPDQELLTNNIKNKFFEFLDMAGDFFNWNRELNSFNMSVYLGASPNSNKEAVIKNWKKYRNQDIIIDEEQIKKEYYGLDD